MYCEQIAIFWCGSRSTGWDKHLLDNRWAEGSTMQSKRDGDRSGKVDFCPKNGIVESIHVVRRHSKFAISMHLRA
jgi:hypothetical protein